MRLPEWLLPGLTACAMWVLPFGAHAQTAEEIQKYLAQQAKGCTLYAYQEYFRGSILGVARPVTVAAYTIEGCGGGNNYARTVDVFFGTGGTVQRMKQPARPISGPDVGDANGVTIQGNQITVRSSEYGPDDARCCPSLKRTASYRLVNGAIVPAG